MFDSLYYNLEDSDKDAFLKDFGDLFMKSERWYKEVEKSTVEICWEFLLE